MGKAQNVFGDFIDDYDEPQEQQVMETTPQVDVLATIAQVPQEPCIKNGKCKDYSNCLDNSLACVRFMHYCSKGTDLPINEKRKRDVTTPTREIFKMIFPNEEGEKVQVYGM
jgi:hypothetical protein